MSSVLGLNARPQIAMDLPASPWGNCALSLLNKMWRWLSLTSVTLRNRRNGMPLCSAVCSSARRSLGKHEPPKPQPG
ncbi:hypothetical protein D3C74_479360 [compost metagenome]